MIISENCFDKNYPQEFSGLELEVSALAVDFMFAIITLTGGNENIETIVCALINPSTMPGEDPKNMHLYWHSMNAQIRTILGKCADTDKEETLQELSNKLRSLPLQDSLEESIRRGN